MNRGAFVLSLDVELVWGSFTHTSPAEFNRRYPDLRRVIASLLGLLAELEIPATWAFVGHLFLSECEKDADGRTHPEVVRPSFPWYPHDWLSCDPGTSRAADPLWYGDDLVDAAAACEVQQEIGSHSFSHIHFGDPACTAEAARSDLNACVELADRRDITLRSFVFPRNSEGHHELLREFGFTCFRGVDPNWYRRVPGAARRIAHLVDDALGVAPPVSVAHEALPGLWNIPGSMLLMSRDGIRRGVPMASRVRKARAGLNAAERESKIFHLWFHPFNLAVDVDRMLAALRSILLDAARRRDAGTLDIAPMGRLAEQLSSA
jgi:hypothetical protein